MEELELELGVRWGSPSVQWLSSPYWGWGQIPSWWSRSYECQGQTRSIPFECVVFSLPAPASLPQRVKVLEQEGPMQALGSWHGVSWSRLAADRGSASDALPVQVLAMAASTVSESPLSLTADCSPQPLLPPPFCGAGRPALALSVYQGTDCHSPATLKRSGPPVMCNLCKCQQWPPPLWSDTAQGPSHLCVPWLRAELSPHLWQPSFQCGIARWSMQRWSIRLAQAEAHARVVMVNWAATGADLNPPSHPALWVCQHLHTPPKWSTRFPQPSCSSGSPTSQGGSSSMSDSRTGAPNLWLELLTPQARSLPM